MIIIIIIIMMIIIIMIIIVVIIIIIIIIIIITICLYFISSFVEARLKVRFSPTKRNRFLFHRKLFKNDEKCFFISTEKFFSFSRYSNLCLDFSITWKSGLIRRIRLISKFVTSQPGKQTIAIHILFNISRSKGN